MTWYIAVAAAVFAATTVWTWVRVHRLYRLVDSEEWPGPRTRRRLSQQMLFAVGWWQLSIAAVIAVGPGTGAPGGASVGMMGLMLIGMSMAWRRLSLP